MFIVEIKEEFTGAVDAPLVGITKQEVPEKLTETAT